MLKSSQKEIYFFMEPQDWIGPNPSIELLKKNLDRGLHSFLTQTFFQLSNSDWKLILTKEMPDEGIVICHRESLDENFKPNRRQLLVCIQADWGRHSFASVHIAQNKAQTNTASLNLFFRILFPGKTFFIHHWPQPEIQTRDASRDNRARNICFFGVRENLAKEFLSQDWQDFIKDLGVEWRVVDDKARWSDYSDTDIALFCRSFDGNEYIHKPATKLYNSWLAGVLPVFTEESAFMDELERFPDAGISVSSYDDLKLKLRQVIEQPAKFDSYLRMGTKAAHSFSHEVISNEWEDLFSALQKEYQRWVSSSLLKFKLFLLARNLLSFIRRNLSP